MPSNIKHNDINDKIAMIAAIAAEQSRASGYLSKSIELTEDEIDVLVENFDQLDEVSKQKLLDYIGHASIDKSMAAHDHAYHQGVNYGEFISGKKGGSHDVGYLDKLSKRHGRRSGGIQLAGAKLAGNGVDKYSRARVAGTDTLTKEDIDVLVENFDQLDEVSAAKLLRYIGASTLDNAVHSQRVGAEKEGSADRFAAVAARARRMKGINQAGLKLAGRGAPKGQRAKVFATKEMRPRNEELTDEAMYDAHSARLRTARARDASASTISFLKNKLAQHRNVTKRYYGMDEESNPMLTELSKRLLTNYIDRKDQQAERVDSQIGLQSKQTASADALRRLRRRQLENRPADKIEKAVLMKKKADAARAAAEQQQNSYNNKYDRNVNLALAKIKNKPTATVAASEEAGTLTKSQVNGITSALRDPRFIK